MNKQNEVISVLIVEDNMGDFLLVENYLQHKYDKALLNHCIDFKSTKLFLENNTADISIILLDLNLPDLSGEQLIERIIPIATDIPILILTGYDDLSVANTCLKLGVSDYLIKDEINPTLLHKSIEFALSRMAFKKHINDQNKNYKNLFDFSPQPMWLIDPDTFAILDANIAAIKNYDFSLDEFKTINFIELHKVSDQTTLRNIFISTNERCESKVYTHILKNGNEISVSLSCRYIQLITGKNVILVQSDDITTTLNYIHTIELQNEKLKEIAWTQSHVVRSPLSRILGLINLIQDSDHNDGANMAYLLNELNNASTELDSVVRSVVFESENYLA